MDAYDIFKKLTKGLTFKRRVLGVNRNNENVKPMLKDVHIKKEESDENEDVVKAQESDDSKSIESQVESESEGDHSSDNLKIVEGFTTNQNKEKKKKKASKLTPEELKKKLELEEHNRFRNEHGIKAIGRHVPSALKDFDDLISRFNVPQGLVDVVTECGYSEPTPVQRQAIPCILEGRQIVACAPTGSGKTAAFLLPLFHLLGAPQGGPRALVLCPTRELAHQIYREALRLSASTQLRCSVIKSVKESKVKEREATIRKSDIVISTPNRLCYMLNQEDVGVSLDKVQWLIIDEADKMFEGSEEEVSTFRQQLNVVLEKMGARAEKGSEKNEEKEGVSKKELRRTWKLAMFSATHTPALAKWARHHMKGLINITVGNRNAASASVDQELLFCGNESGKLVAFRQLIQKGLKPPVLVFVQSKERARQLFKELIYDGVHVDVIHAGRTQAQRDNVVRSFRVGRIWVLICTELMGRGMDFRGVNLVLNYDFPPSAISYVHRVGRAGRAGQRGRAITLFTHDDVANLRSIASVLKQSGCAVPEYMLALRRDPGKRRRLLQRAPRRDHISTLLQKPDKRKLEEEPKETDPKYTKQVENAKRKKLRKLNNDESNVHKKSPRNAKKATLKIARKKVQKRQRTPKTDTKTKLGKSKKRAHK